MNYEEILKLLYNRLIHDGYCWWLPDWAISEEHNTEVENKPTFEEFLKVIKSYE